MYAAHALRLPHPAGWSIEEANRKVNAWIETLREEEERMSDSDDWYERFGSISISTVDAPDGDAIRQVVWLSNDESANVEAAGNLIARYLEDMDFPPNAAVYFSWASYCSKPRINEATGGAAVISQQSSHWINSYSILDQAIGAWSQGNQRLESFTDPEL